MNTNRKLILAALPFMVAALALSITGPKLIALICAGVAAIFFFGVPYLLQMADVFVQRRNKQRLDQLAKDLASLFPVPSQHRPSKVKEGRASYLPLARADFGEPDPDLTDEALLEPKHAPQKELNSMAGDLATLYPPPPSKERPKCRFKAESDEERIRRQEWLNDWVRYKASPEEKELFNQLMEDPPRSPKELASLDMNPDEEDAPQ